MEWNGKLWQFHWQIRHWILWQYLNLPSVYQRERQMESEKESGVVNWMFEMVPITSLCYRDCTMKAFYISKRFGMPAFHESTSLHGCKLIKIRVRRFNCNCSGLGCLRLWFYSWLFHTTCLWLARLLRQNNSNLFVWNLGLQFISSLSMATSFREG